MAKPTASIVALVLTLFLILAGIVVSIGGLQAPLGRPVPMETLNVEAQETVERTIQTGQSPFVIIDNPVGSVVIKAWDRPEVGLEAVKKAYAENDEHAQQALREIGVDLYNENGIIKIGTTLPHPPSGAYSFPSRGFVVEYFITAPVETEIVELRVARGTASVSGITGAMRQVTANGTVQITGSRGDVSAQSTRGGIYILNAEGYLSLKANGEVQVKDAEGVTLDSISSRGPFSFSGRLTKGAENHIQAYGPASLSVPGDSELALDLEANRGDIKVGLPVGNEEKSSRENALEVRVLKGIINRPSSILQVKSSSGGIVIQEQK